MHWFSTLNIAALLVPAAAGSVAVPRQPTASWVVNFDNARCVASRNYGTTEAPLFLVLKASPLGDVMQLAILRQGNGGGAWTFDAKLQVDDQPVLSTSLLVYEPGKASLTIGRINLRTKEFAPFRQAKRFAIWSPGLNETFALSNMGPLLKTMDECLVGLRRLWNITDPTGDRSNLMARAKVSLGPYVNYSEFAATLYNLELSDTFAFALLIDEAGKVADCTIIELSGLPVLDSQACGKMEQQAKFKPAIGTDGKPAKDGVFSRIIRR